MYINSNNISWIILVFLVLIIGVCVPISSSAEMSDLDFKYLRYDDPVLVTEDIINFKGRLYECGFYTVGVNDNTLQSKELDDLTMAAVNLVCVYNPDLIYYTEGVSYLLYWRVMGLDGKELKTPLDEQYKPLRIGSNGDGVAKVQNRLNQLGYDAAGFTFTPGLYDEQLQLAIDEFVRCNKYVYNRDDGITVEMQEFMFSEQALHYTPVAPDTRSFSEKVFAYLGASTSVAGLNIPNFLLIMLGFVLLCIIVLLVLKLASPSEPTSPRKEKTRSMKSGELEFNVEYDGEVFVHRADVKDYVRIGRATGNFPLNMNDASISRKHCEICMENGNLMLRDFSSYGTRINGELCHHSQHVLHSGDVIDVGDHRITIQFKK